jgi:hypothetical protein
MGNHDGPGAWDAAALVKESVQLRTLLPQRRKRRRKRKRRRIGLDTSGNKNKTNQHGGTAG